MEKYEDAMKYLKTSLMFNLSLSSNELFHSNFLYWIWQSNQDAFKQIINGLVGEKDWWEKNCENKQIEVRREYKNFDLSIVEVINNKILFVLENKVKSIPYAQQLIKYNAKIEENNQNKNKQNKQIPCYKLLLSLSDTFPDVKFDESNQFEGWKRKSYKEYYDILRGLTQISNTSSYSYYQEYCDYVERLIICTNEWDRFPDLEDDGKQFGKYEYLKDAEELRMHAFYYMFNTAKLCCMLINKLSDNLSGKENVQLQYFGNEDDSILLSDNKEHDNYFHENKEILVGVGYEYSHQKPILEVKVAKKTERIFYIIQIQGESYEHGIIKKCSRYVLENKIIPKNKNFKDWVTNIPLCSSDSDIFSSEEVLPEDKYNGYNATYSMVYKYRKLNEDANEDATVENVLNQIVCDIEYLIGKL